MLVWRCECGQQFEELGREDPGNVSGWMAAKDHVGQHKKNGEPEVLTGLWDTETGERIWEGGMRPVAVRAGVLPYAKEKADVVSGSKGTGPLAGKILVREIPIDPVVYICFLEAKAMDPRSYPDDAPQTISGFITECVLGFFRLCPETFTMSKIIEAAVRGVLRGPDDIEEEGVPTLDDILAPANYRAGVFSGGFGGRGLDDGDNGDDDDDDEFYDEDDGDGEEE
ncbi:MAG TPA: hypothetical protein PLG04_00140 [Anaerolineaceae bacterium]|jgi:hypothetical protein|nr:hypothetical protein [Anaerolineaceae bacterium]